MFKPSLELNRSWCHLTSVSRFSRELLLYLKYILKLIFKGFSFNRCLIFKVRRAPLSCGVLDYITKSHPICQHLFSIFFHPLVNRSVCFVIANPRFPLCVNGFQRFIRFEKFRFLSLFLGFFAGFQDFLLFFCFFYHFYLFWGWRCFILIRFHLV